VPFSPSDEGRLFGAPELALENPALLGGREGEELLFALDGVRGERSALGLQAAWLAPGLALAGGLQAPPNGFFRFGLAERGYGVGGLADFRGRFFGAGLGYAGAVEGWAWLDVRRGRARLSLYHRRSLGNGRLLFALRVGSGGWGRITGYYGQALASGDERLWLWGGLGVGLDARGSAADLLYGARWRSPVFGGPVVVDLAARGWLSLQQSDQAFLLRLHPLAFHADWLYRFPGGELRFRLPYLRLVGEDGGLRFELAAGLSGRIALP